MDTQKTWRPLKSGCIILTLWSVLNGLVGLGCVIYIVVLQKNAPGLLMLFKPSEILLLGPKVLAIANAIAIIANACIAAYCTAVLFIIWKALIDRQRWAFWCLTITIAFSLIAGFLSDSFLGNMNIATNIISTIMALSGLGLSAYSIFNKGNQSKAE